MLAPNRVVNEWALPVRRWLSGDVLGSAERTRAHIDRLSRKPARHRPPRWLGRGVRVRELGWRDWPVYEVAPKGSGAGIRIVYLHGGSYMDEITLWHWFLIAETVKRTGATCLVPIYPLIPRATAEKLVAETAEYLSEAGPTILMGDSAGGGLALATALAMRDSGATLPARLVLLSPFLDVSVSDPRQEPLLRKDKMLGRQGLAEAGRIYAAGLPLDDPRVSPIFGRLEGLPPITVFTGTHDILDVDSRRLVERAEGFGIQVDLHEAPGAPHVYPAFPTPQGAAGRREIAAVCQQTGQA